MHRIVIVGGGAGGLELATRLGNRLGKAKLAHITLVDCRPTHIWKPLLHEVATGSLDTQVHQIEYAAQAAWHHFDFVQGTLEHLNRSSKHLRLASVKPEVFDGSMASPDHHSLEYHTLVLALGSRTHYFGVPGAQDHGVALDTVEQAEVLRRRLLHACIKHRTSPLPGRSAAANVAIIGGGATGVELAAELRRMERELRRFRLHSKDRSSELRITLLEAGDRLLPALPVRVSSTTVSLLEDLDIEVSVGDPVTEVRPESIHTKSGRVIPTDIAIWAAGIKAPDCLASLDGLATNHINQIKVSNTLQSVSDGDVFALGDCSSCEWIDGRPVPPRAQAAHQQAAYLAKALALRVEGRPLGSFAYSDYGSLVSLGNRSAVGNLSTGILGENVIVRGYLAGVMYAALYRKHITTISGLRRSLAGLAMHAFRRVTSPRIKLH